MLHQPEYEATGKIGKNGYYVFGIDVGRRECTTEVMVFKVSPQPQGASIKSLVNIYTWEAEHFGIQSINIKRLYYKYKPKAIAVDANGLGAGLIDFLVINQEDPDTGEILPNFGVGGATYAEWEKDFKKFKNADTIHDILYLIKANAPINTEAHTYAQTQISTGKVKFLIDENQAKVKLMGTKVGQAMDADKRADYLRPFTLTTILREQILNLVEKTEGVNIILNQSSRSIKKDKFSAFEYGLYYIKKEEDKNKKRKKASLADFMFMN